MQDKSFQVTDLANDLYMTLFKVSTVELNTFTVSFLYFCTPLTYSLNEVVLEINIPGCGKMIVSWMKRCGDAMSMILIYSAPHPGLQAQLVDPATKNTQSLLRDGLVMYPNLKADSLNDHSKIEDLLPEFRVSIPTIEFVFYNRLDDVNYC
jgi:hypothetical protein